MNQVISSGLRLDSQRSAYQCVGFWWDRASNEMRPAPPAGGMPFLRLVFMDLNLAEQGGVPDASNLATVVMSVLKQLVSPSGGPYLLVFWTQVGTRVEAVSKIIYERLEKVENVPAPVSIIELDKKPFLIKDPAKQDFSGTLKSFMRHCMETWMRCEPPVRKAVERMNPRCRRYRLGSRGPLRRQQARSTRFTGARRSTAPNPNAGSIRIQKVMAKVAVAAAGESAAHDNPAGALDAASSTFSWTSLVFLSTRRVTRLLSK